MRITQADYSAIMNANAQKFQIQQVGLQNKQFREDIAFNNTIRGLQRTIDIINDTKSIANDITNIVKIGYGIDRERKRQIAEAENENKKDYNIRLEAESGEADTFMDGLLKTVNTAISQTALDGGSANRDADGNVVLNQNLLDLKASQQADLDEYEALPEVKAAMQTQFDEIWKDAEYNLGQGLIKRDIAARDASRDDALNKAIYADSFTDGSENTDKLIDSWGDKTVDEKDYLKGHSRDLIENQRQKNLAAEAAAEKQAEVERKQAETAANKQNEDNMKNWIVDSVTQYGLAPVLKAIDESDYEGKKKQEYATYAQGVEANIIKKLAAQNAEQFNLYLAGTELPMPSSYRDNVNAEMGNLGWSVERKDAINKALDTVQAAWINKQMEPTVRSLPYMTEEELDATSKSIESGANSILFLGMEDEKSNYLDQVKTFKTQRKNEREAYEKADEKFNKDALEKFQKEINATTALLNNGQTSAQDSLAYLTSFMNSNFADVSPSTRLEMETRLLNWSTKYIEQAKIPSKFTTARDNFMKTLEKTGKEYYKNAGMVDDLEIMSKITHAQSRATASLLDYCLNNPLNEISEKDFEDKCNKILDGYFGENIQLMEEKEYITPTEQGLVYDNADNLPEMVQNLENASGSVYVNEEKQFEWRNTETQSVFDSLALFGKSIIEDTLGLKMKGAPIPRQTEDGEAEAIPEFEDSNGNIYTFNSKGDFVQTYQSGAEYDASGRHTGNINKVIIPATAMIPDKSQQKVIVDKKFREGIQSRLADPNSAWNQVNWDIT